MKVAKAYFNPNDGVSHIPHAVTHFLLLGEATHFVTGPQGTICNSDFVIFSQNLSRWSIGLTKFTVL
jgi:hypothetical protein